MKFPRCRVAGELKGWVSCVTRRKAQGYLPVNLIPLGTRRFWRPHANALDGVDKAGPSDRESAFSWSFIGHSGSVILSPAGGRRSHLTRSKHSPWAEANGRPGCPAALGPPSAASCTHGSTGGAPHSRDLEQVGLSCSKLRPQDVTRQRRANQHARKEIDPARQARRLSACGCGL
jgi:hypothetical protein